MNGDERLVEVRDLKMHFPLRGGGLLGRRAGVVKAVDGVRFEIRQGETLGLVGESGCGKTTVGRCLVMLYRPTAGQVLFQGQDLTRLRGEALRHRRRSMQMIFQDPYSSLNPRLTVGSIIGEPLVVHGVGDGRARRQRVRDLMEIVGLNPYFLNRYPHEFSAGQRQRIGIARALALEPSLVVCDEPVSALDVSIQAQILNLLKDLQQRFSLAYLFIAHDLAVVRYISDRVAVMYLGRLMEMAPSREIYENPLHPYTRALLSAVPIPDPAVEAGREHILLTGEVPSPAYPPSGCVFHTRCPMAVEECRRVVPEFRQAEAGHWVACIRV